MAEWLKGFAWPGAQLFCCRGAVSQQVGLFLCHVADYDAVDGL
jgi:hypothetical protein